MVSRRRFMQAIAAAMSVPIIDLRAGVPREKLLLDFCGEDYLRYDLKQPFGVGSLTYATDSKAMIRTELANRCEVGEMKIPPVGNVWSAHWEPTGQWRDLDETMLTPTIVRKYQSCPKCGGDRVSFGESYPDNHHDWYVLVSEYAYDPDDNTIRNRSCDVCHGRDYTGAAVSDVLGIEHSTYNLKRIAALPHAQVCRSAYVEHAVLFRADGFQGISLGYHDDDE